MAAAQQASEQQTRLAVLTRLTAFFAEKAQAVADQRVWWAVALGGVEAVQGAAA